MKNSGLFLIFLLSLMLVCGFQFQKAEASSSLNGVISSNVTWSKDAGPWNLTSNVLIDSGVTVTLGSGAVLNINEFYIRVNGTLIIQPGATINMKTMGSSIQVNGVLTVRGTSENPIHINGDVGYYALIAPPTYSSISFSVLSVGWNDQTQSGSIIEYAIINSTSLSLSSSVKVTNNVIDTSIYCKSGSPVIYKNTIKSALSIEGGAPVITANTFAGGNIVSYSENLQGDTVISNNVISNPQTVSGGSTGFSFGGGGASHVLFENNLIMGCYYGIRFFNPNFDNVNTALTIKDNTITGNQIGLYISNCYPSAFTGNNIVNNSVNAKMFTDNSGKSRDISVPNNWWGTTSTAAIDQSIYDFSDDFNLGKVSYTPILTSENKEAYPDSTVPIPSTSVSPTPTSTVAPTSTAEQNSNSTVQPTMPTNPAQNPTSNPSNQTSNPTSTQQQSFFGADWITTAIIALLTLIAVLLAVNILYMRRRAKP